MALSLTAEQKSLSDILSKREQIIIPPYQRPYSWGIEECYQLYQDFLDAYNSDSDYFIGNITTNYLLTTTYNNNMVNFQSAIYFL